MVMVAADIPDCVSIDWSNFEGTRSYAGLLAVGRLHAASLARAQSLAGRWQASGIDVTAIRPGQVDTGIYRETSADTSSRP